MNKNTQRGFSHLVIRQSKGEVETPQHTNPDTSSLLFFIMQNRKGTKKPHKKPTWNSLLVVESALFRGQKTNGETGREGIIHATVYLQ